MWMIATTTPFNIMAIVANHHNASDSYTINDEKLAGLKFGEPANKYIWWKKVCKFIQNSLAKTAQFAKFTQL